MKYRSRRREILFVSLCIAALPAAYAGFSGGGRALAAAEEPAAVLNATRSSPIAITSDDQFVWSVNPDNNSVSVFRVARTRTRRSRRSRSERSRGASPSRPTTRKVYVTNMVSGTVSVIDAQPAEGGQDDQGRHRAVRLRAHAGRQPALRRQPVVGRPCRSSTRARDYVVETIKDVGPKPHGIAITADGKQGLRHPVPRAEVGRRSAAADAERGSRRRPRRTRHGDRRAQQSRDRRRSS